jgi:hypothetical protein
MGALPPYFEENSYNKLQKKELRIMNNALRKKTRILDQQYFSIGAFL